MNDYKQYEKEHSSNFSSSFSVALNCTDKKFFTSLPCSICSFFAMSIYLTNIDAFTIQFPATSHYVFLRNGSLLLKQHYLRGPTAFFVVGPFFEAKRGRSRAKLRHLQRRENFSSKLGYEHKRFAEGSCD